MDNRNYSKGISWIDDCRIPFTDGGWGTRHNKEYPEWKGAKNFTHPEQILSQNSIGRFPANILVSDDMLNDGNVGQNNSKNQEWGLNDDFKVNEYLVGLKKTGISRIADKGTNSRYYDIDKWFDKILDV